MDDSSLPVGFDTTMKRFMFAAIGGSVFFVSLFWFYPPDIQIHYFGALYILVNTLIIRAFLSVCPKSKTNWMVFGLIVSFVSSFIPISWYFVIESWRGHWTLVESFPPILPFIVIASAMMLLMMTSRWLFFSIVASWFLISTPVVTYLFFHRAEMLSPRGLELLFAFGPTSIFFILVIPYQMAFANKYHRMLSILKRTKEEADRDFLTDLRNRKGLYEWRRFAREDCKIAVMMTAIKDFGSINQEFGHSIGDRVLNEFASRLRLVYQGEHMLARWRGEEFAVVLVEPNEDEMEYVIDDFQSWLGASGYSDIGETQIHVMLGVSEIKTIRQFDELIEQANTGLIQSRKKQVDVSTVPLQASIISR